MMIRKILVVTFIAIALGVPTVAAQETDTDNIDTVIMASTENYPDALVAASAGSKTGSPMLLTEQDAIPAETDEALEQMNPGEIVLVGGEAVISAEVEAELEDRGYNVTRLWGVTRYGTAVEVADHFWVEGADEAMLVQNGLEDADGNVVAAAKELARDEEIPVYLTPEGEVPAVVLSSLEDLGVQEVTVVGTAVSDAYRSDLTDTGVEVDDEITGSDEDDVEEEVERRMAERMNASDTLVAVASAGFGHAIASANMPHHRVVHVSAEDDAQDLVELVNDRGITRVKVAGQPELAESTAAVLRDGTDASVDLTVATASEAVKMNANLTRREIPAFAKNHRKKMQQWEERRQERMEHVRQRVNETIARAERLVDENASTEAQDALDEARQHYRNGDYEDAREAAMEAMDEVRRDRYREMRDRHHEELREAVREEMESLRERVEELKELNREFGEEMEENMTTEERLETIEEFRHERREVIEEMMAETGEIEGDLEERLNEARKRTRERTTGERFEADISCADDPQTAITVDTHDEAVSVDGTVALPNPVYAAKHRFDVDNASDTVTVTVEFAEQEGMGITCVGEAEIDARTAVAAGEWTVEVVVNVDEDEEYRDTVAVTVPEDDSDDEDEADDSDDGNETDGGDAEEM